MLSLAHYGWPYNVRELESAVKLSLALCESPELDLSHLPTTIQQGLDHHGEPARAAPPSASSASGATAPSESDLRALIEKHGGNLAAVGRELGKKRMQIHRWLKRYEIDVEEYR